MIKTKIIILLLSILLSVVTLKLFNYELEHNLNVEQNKHEILKFKKDIKKNKKQRIYNKKDHYKYMRNYHRNSPVS